ncbi:MAG: RluA family pseudouridine synthase [Lachnospiraceae bacterium]|nr:RluA family pseudouridine synthase [Lachnospiraceae bacterium]
MDGIKIIFENDELIVVDKPSGMPTHPSRIHQGDSLADAVAGYLHDPGFVFRAINRLDRETSGLVIIAKNRQSAARLSELMRSNKIQREYEAEISDDGSIADHGTIDAPISRYNPEDPHDIRRTVDFENGERAVTHYTVIDRGPGYARVRCTLETGRTHQIRVHMSYIGHPIIGDSLYNPLSKPGDMAKLRAVKLTVGDDPVLIFEI